MSRAVGDGALEGRVQRLVEDFASSGAPLTCDAVLQALFAKHREYARKPQQVLRKAVASSIERARRKLGAFDIGAETPLDNDEMDGSGNGAAAPDTTTAPSASLNDTLYSSMKSKAIAPEDAPATSEKKPVKGTKRKRPASTAEGDGDGKLPSSGPQSGDPNAAPQWELPPYMRPSTRYADIGGLSVLLTTLRQVVEYPLLHPELYAHLGVEPPRGVLLHGPPGVGKTLLANAIAGELGVYFRSVAGPELVGGLSGESEQRLRMVFDDAARNAPSILFIDEIDAIAPKREGTSRGMERRMVAQLLSCIDGVAPSFTGGKTVLVVGATNRPDSLDPGLRRAGRFDREVSVPIPDEDARLDILKVLTRGMRLDTSLVGPAAGASTSAAAAGPGAGAGGQAGDGASFDLRAIARLTPGYVGADLAALAKEAAASAIDRVLGGHELLDQRPGGQSTGPTGRTAAQLASAGAEASAAGADEAMDGSSSAQASSSAAVAHSVLDGVLPFSALQLSEAGVCVTHADFVAATKRVQPSALREGFATAPNVTWADVGALQDVRAELEMAIVQPLRRPEVFAALGLRVPAGVLLYGPPGCGKTLLAKAIAAESNANFISVKGPELLDKYVGESERAVRQVFARARSSAPCIIFFDELDSLAPRRGGEGGGGGGSSSNVTERVVNQLLTELDGLDVRRDVFVVAATNRPDIIDPAMLRPGRLDKLLYVPLPTPAERASILRTHVRTMPLGGDVDVPAVAADARCARFSGADLASLVREAAVAALREFFETEAAANGTGADLAGGSGSIFGSGPAAGSGLGSGVPLPRIAARHFATAFQKVQPSVSVADEKLYNALRTKLRRAPIGSSSAACGGQTPAPAAGSAGTGGPTENA